MPRYMKTLNVIANPYAGGYASLDAEGRGHAHATYFGQGPEAVIGATVHHEATKAEETWVFTFDKDASHPSGRPVIKLLCAGKFGPQMFAHYARLIQEGVLVAADEKTARQANVDFKEPAEVIEADRARAIATWESQHDESPLCADENHAHGGKPLEEKKPEPAKTETPKGAAPKPTPDPATTTHESDASDHNAE